MATQTFNCPNCGAPIEYDGSDTPAIKCPFCENSVVIPPELRPQKPPQIQTINISLPEASTYKTAGRVSGAVLALIIGCTVLFVGAMIALPIYLTQRATSLAENALKDNPLVAQVTSIVHQLTEVPTVTLADACICAGRFVIWSKRDRAGYVERRPLHRRRWQRHGLCR
jgi:hypothetical protein